MYHDHDQYLPQPPPPTHTSDIPILPLLADIVMDLSPTLEDSAPPLLEGGDTPESSTEHRSQSRQNTREQSTDLRLVPGVSASGGGGESGSGGELEEQLGVEPGGSSTQEQQLLGVTYAMNDMCFSIGFFLGPLVGTGVETAFGDGQTGETDLLSKTAL